MAESTSCSLATPNIKVVLFSLLSLIVGALLGRASLDYDHLTGYSYLPLPAGRAPTYTLDAKSSVNTCPPQPCNCQCNCQPCSIPQCPTCEPCKTEPSICPPSMPRVCPQCPPCGEVKDCIARNRSIIQAYGAYAKRVAVPAAKRINGLLIGELLPELQFRPGYAYGQINDVEDTSHLVPWLLGNQIDLNGASRRVLLDLGANKFDTSTAWFMRNYPVNFDEIHAFEVNPGMFSPPFDIISRLPHPPNVTRYETKVGIRNEARSNLGVPGVNILEFITENLKIRREDTLIVKMDIEGTEWEVLPTLLQNPAALQVIDELFVEIHYGDPIMSRCGWDSFYPRKLSDALALVDELRNAGLRTHFWP